MSKKDKECQKDCLPFFCDCECESTEASVTEQLVQAMEEEKKMAKFYRYMLCFAQCESDKEFFHQLRCNSKNHFKLLQEIYRDLTCLCYTIDFVDVKHPKGFCQGIKKAICREMELVKFYEDFVPTLCDVQHKEIICYILNQHKEHAQQLAVLYKLAQECACKCRSEVAGESCKNYC